MVATVTTKIYVGVVTGTPQDLPASNLRFCASDDYNPGNTYPIPIPGTSYNYSYTKSLAFYVTGAPDTSITNIYIYGDTTSWGTGIAVMVGTSFPSTYVEATGTLGTTGNEMTTFYTGTVNAVDFQANYTSVAPLGPIGQAINSGTGRYSYFVIFQARVGTTGTSGAKTPKTVTWRYDEV